MNIAQEGSNVHVHYTGRLSDGSVFDSSEGREPLAFVLGSGSVIAGFDEGLTGMAVGDKKTIEIEAKDAYGDLRDDMLFEIDREEFPAEVSPEIGQQLQIGLENGGVMPVVVTAVAETKVTLDANHPLAGKDLTFDLELVSIG